ncbi:MAG: type II secretion system F family protein [Candidatus Planktophila sp.]
MNPQISIPCAIAVIAFFVADEKSNLLHLIYRRSLNLGNRASVIERLSQIGKNKVSDYENFRITQMVFVAVGFALSTVAFFLTVINWTAYCLFLVLVPVITFVLTERNLTQRCESRRKNIESEFPAIVEMLTLAVGAGESPALALKRISNRAHGHLAREFSRVVLEIENGIPLMTALDEMSRRVNSNALRRFADSIIVSISRGTSLVETLTHSANESRNQERVRLLNAAGKSEISMMIPVVFLILPISILFALYPSLINLNLFSS